MGSWNLFGHMHGSYHKDRLHAGQIDVGVDCWGYKPVSLQEIKVTITKRYLNKD